MARGIALLVGLKSVDPDAYHGWDGKSGAKGCEFDVDNMANILSSAGEYEVNTLKTQQATASAILAGIESAASILKSDDMFVFYYSGHGGQKLDINGDETDGNDETLVAYDREIIDDELAELWPEFASGVHIVMLSDSCNSGTNFFIAMRTKPINFAGKIPGMKAQMIHFGACRDGEASAGYLQGSAFTLALCEVWKNGSFSGTYLELYEAIKKRLKRADEPQEPQFTLLGEVQPAFLNSKPFSLS